MKRYQSQRGGSTLMEFTLVGIPIVFLLISVFELCRGMWTYQALSAAVKAGTRYTVVHGQNCSITGNTCTVTIAQIAGRMKSAAPGLLQDQWNLTFTPATGTAVSDTMTNCLSNSTVWPPSNANALGSDVKISGTYPFRSIISMFWPSAGGPVKVNQVTFGAASKERVQF